MNPSAMQIEHSATQLGAMIAASTISSLGFTACAKSGKFTVGRGAADACVLPAPAPCGGVSGVASLPSSLLLLLSSLLLFSGSSSSGKSWSAGGAPTTTMSPELSRVVVLPLLLLLPASSADSLMLTLP
jgi:hypothetical protein